MTLLHLALRTSNVIGGVRYFVLPDDGMISMRYARNFAEGVGLVWNPGEHVQGFTNPAWTMIMAAVHWAGLPSRLTSLPLQLASLALHLLTGTYIWWRVARRSGPSWAIGAAAAYLTASCTLTWAISGWETSAVALGWALALDPAVLDDEQGADRMWRSLGFAGLTVLFRPDAALLLGALGAYWVVTAGAARRGRALLGVAVAAAPALALAIFQQEYYGSWIPNTATLKRSAGLLSATYGIEYVLVSLIRYPFNGAVLLAAVFGAARLQRPSAVLAALFAAIYLGYVVWVGGDAFTHARFLLPLLPTATVLAVDWVSRITIPSDRRRAFLIRAATVAMVSALAFDFADAALVAVPEQKNLNRTALITALALQDLSVDRTPIVGIFLAGTIPYYNPSVSFHDMLGKNEPHIARTEPHSGRPGHNRWDYDYSLDRIRPDLIVTSYPIAQKRLSLRRTGFRRTGDFYQDLYDQAQFADLYLPSRVPLKFGDESVHMFEAYARKDGAFAASQ